MNQACSAIARDEQLAGTAPAATAWLIIEQPGSWGPQALVESGLDPELGAFLTGLTPEYGVRVLLVRHVDRPERSHDGKHNVWVARVSAAGPVLRHVVLDDLSALRDWDYAAMAIGYLPEVGEIETAPLLLVCAHGRRDACCAVEGRSFLSAVLDAAGPEQRGRVWESSHIAGHRFAPVALSLPFGAVHGRMSAEVAPQFLQRAMDGQIMPEYFRGRTCYPAPFQAAGAYVRNEIGLADAGQLDVQRVVGGKAVPAHPTAALFETEATAEVRHQDGRAWRLTVRQIELPVPRPDSCGAEPSVAFEWRVVSMEQIRG